MQLEGMQKSCPYHKRCGGCSYQDISYEEQLKEKQKLVEIQCGSFGKVAPIHGMHYPYYYRNKVHAVFGQKRNGEILCGTYEADSHRIVDIEECLIEDKIATAIIRDIKGLLPSFKIRPYYEDTGRGLLRHVLVRRGFATGEVMVVLVLSSPVFPSKNNFIKALRKQHPEITTVLLNVNDKKTSMVLGDQETVLYGKGYIVDELLGYRFRISAKSFYQVNPVQTKALYQKAIALAGLTGKERVLDAYCGIGTIGLIASGKADQVVAVELNPQAVKDGIANAKANGVKNVRFVKADATEYMMQAAAAGERFDVVFMDPPRAGSTREFTEALLALAPKRVVYISCNPQTLSRDLQWFGRAYHVEGFYPYDMFPFSGHVECVTLLTKVQN
jgi:23S rRNA (uracil1939-C5)-methyltransferase